MLKRIKLWYCIPVLFLCVLVATLSLVHSQYANITPVDRVLAFVMSLSINQAQNANLPSDVKLTQEQYADIQATLDMAEMRENLQMQPIVQRVQQLSTETLDESFRKLATYDNGQYNEPGFMTQSVTEHTDMQRLLSNRRVIKVLQEFENLPFEQAKDKAEELHKIAMNHISRVINTKLDQYEKTREPLPHDNEHQHAKYMIMTSLLLSASLGDIPLVMRQIDELGQGPEDVRKRILANKTLYPSGLKDCTLENTPYFDTTSFVSILMFAVERSGTAPENVKRKIAEASCEIVDIPLVEWNADRTYYDELRYGGNVSMTQDSVQIFFRIYNFSSSWINEQTRNQNSKFFWSLHEIIASTK